MKLEVSQVKALATPTMGIKIFCQGTVFDFNATPDTGASATIISSKLMAEKGLTIYPCSVPLTQADGSRLSVDGCVYASVEYLGKTIHVGCFVSSAIKDGLLLSWFHMDELGLLSEKYPREEASRIRSVGVGDTLDAIRTNFRISYPTPWSLLVVE